MSLILVWLFHYTYNLFILSVSGHHVGQGHTLGVPGEPQEVHPRHQDGLRWPQEEERASRSDCLSGICNQIIASSQLSRFYQIHLSTSLDLAWTYHTSDIFRTFT